MFPLTFIEVGNTLSQHIMFDDEIATTSLSSASSSSSSSASITTLTQQHLLQQQQLNQQQQHDNITTDIIWKNSLLENITRTSLLGVGSSSSNSGVGGGGLSGGGADITALDGFDSDSTFTPPLQRPETIFIIILFLLIFIVGVLGNGTLVIIFFRHRSMRNIPNTYILSLALADLLVIIVCVPLAILVYTTDSWTFGKSMCQVTEFFKDVSIGVSVFTLTALSGERYCAIVNPLRKLQTKPLTVITAAMIWLLSITFATPSLVMSDLQHILIDDKTNLTIIICTPFGKQRNNSEIYARYVVVTKAFVYYLLPLFIIAVLYLMMAQRLHVSARDMPGETLSMQSRSQVRARRYVARMVVAFVVVFFVCFFPYHLFELWFHLNPTAREDFDEFWHTIRIIGFCTYFLNSCVNPVALYCVSGAFRAHFNQYLCCFCVKRQTRLRQHSTATGMMDTSIVNMSMRSTTNYNRASVHLNNAHCTGGGSGGGGGIGGASFNSNNNTNGLGRLSAYNHHSHRRQSTMQHQHNGNSNSGLGVNKGGGGVGGGLGVDNGRLTAATAVAQSGVILNDKR
ncbi:Neuropeptide CCHamide-2 receptor [Lucilia cuprina]|nr:Neuropeptide CCHamide-2 receptor [Lucilia cuprina]KAI8120054.1 Neuropeptide CCHamide-2 receptor [Lucilia cuprina]